MCSFHSRVFVELFLSSASVGFQSFESMHHRQRCGVNAVCFQSLLTGRCRLTVWFMVCCWPHTQAADLARRGPIRVAGLPVWKQFSRDHVWQGQFQTDVGTWLKDCIIVVPLRGAVCVALVSCLLQILLCGVGESWWHDRCSTVEWSWVQRQCNQDRSFSEETTAGNSRESATEDRQGRKSRQG